MKHQALKVARLKKGWNQTQAARRLRVTQAYLNMLERGKRRLTPGLIRRFALAYGLSPETLPVPEEFRAARADNQDLAESLSKLGYPGFAYLRTRAAQKNPSEVLLTALAQDRLEGRVAEALPWVILQYWQSASGSPWLVEQARKLNLQNRLGFVVSLARQIAERDPDRQDHRTIALRELESKLGESRLAKEDAFYRPPRTEGEKEWLKQNRSADAAHWNLLTDMQSEHLQYV
jgi:transcriptional regulator with XRE-family HTH domain